MIRNCLAARNSIEDERLRRVDEGSLEKMCSSSSKLFFWMKTQIKTGQITVAPHTAWHQQHCRTVDDHVLKTLQRMELRLSYFILQVKPIIAVVFFFKFVMGGKGSSSLLHLLMAVVVNTRSTHYARGVNSSRSRASATTLTWCAPDTSDEAARSDLLNMF